MLLLLATVVLAGCEADLGDSGPRTPNTCVIKADDPHYSTTAGRLGRREIVSKGWFTCSVGLEDGSLTVEMQRLAGGDWRYEAGGSVDVHPVQPKRKNLHLVAIPCRDGQFRTRARLSAHDLTGEYSRSPWYYGKAVTDPCARR